MSQQPPFAPEPPPRPRRIVPFPIIGPGCCGCGFVASLLLALGGAGVALHGGTHDASAAHPPVPAVTQATQTR